MQAPHTVGREQSKDFIVNYKILEQSKSFSLRIFSVVNQITALDVGARRLCKANSRSSR